MTLQRADRLREPPIVGKYYLVPAIRWVWGGVPYEYCASGEILKYMNESPSALWWPVWGNKHNDVEFFGFENQHYHVDPRYFTQRHWRKFWAFADISKLGRAQGSPLNHNDLKDGPPKPTLRKMRCTVAHSQWEHTDIRPVVELNEKFKGSQCAKGKRGFVCPHKHFALGPVQAIDGVITCPLHGLRIDATTGKCIGPATASLPGSPVTPSQSNAEDVVHGVES